MSLGSPELLAIVTVVRNSDSRLCMYTYIVCTHTIGATYFISFDRDEQLVSNTRYKPK